MAALNSAVIPRNPGKKPNLKGSNATAGISTDARFGKRSLELSVPANPQANWIGWRSVENAVEPGATYLLSGWIKSVGLKGTANIHAHFHTASGALTKSGAMVSTRQGASGDSDWILSSAYVQAPPDATKIVILPSINTQGLVRFDGLLFCRIQEGIVGDFHSLAGDTARIFGKIACLAGKSARQGVLGHAAAN